MGAEFDQVFPVAALVGGAVLATAGGWFQAKWGRDHASERRRVEMECDALYGLQDELRSLVSASIETGISFTRIGKDDSSTPFRRTFEDATDAAAESRDKCSALASRVSDAGLRASIFEVIEHANKMARMTDEDVAWEAVKPLWEHLRKITILIGERLRTL